MARQALASMLDELMGKHRNVLPSEKPPDIGFEDTEVCKYFLAGFCHHDLFTNTKADIGPCGKTHDEKLREDYRFSVKFEKLGYEDDWLIALQRVHNDMQRKIVRNKQRLDLTQSGGKVEDVNKESVEGKIDSLSEKITALLQQAETLGAQGRVAEAQKLIEKTEELSAERERCRKTADLPMSDLKAMEVCDTCGCFLIVGDSQHRIDEHLTGKQHLGFAKIKATIEELVARKEEKRRELDEQRKETVDREKINREPGEPRREREHHQHDHRRRRRSRSRSPDRDAGYSRNRYPPQRHAHERRQRDFGESRRYYRSNYEQNSRGFSRRTDDERYSSYRRRSRSPADRRKRSSDSGRPARWNEGGGYSRRDVPSSDSTAIGDDSSTSHGCKVNSPSSSPHCGRKGRDRADNDEEEGLIQSSDE